MVSTTAPPNPKSGTTRPSDPRLSEVARHIVGPTGITRTYWNAVQGQCVDLGLEFDRWQDGAGRLILSQRATGRYAAGIGGVHLSWPRQVGKTYLIGAIIIALCLLRPNMLALWTAHHGKTINETFRAMQTMAKRRRIAPFVRRIVTGNGDEGIEFHNGSRILFGAREHGFGLGFSKVSLLVFDEAQRLTQRAITDMVPTTNAGDNPLVFYIGTPPRPEDRGDVFVRRRKKALEVEAARASGEDPRYNALYIELSADRTTSPDGIDWEQVGKANPSYPHRVDRDAIERMWEQIGSEDFWREGYGIWDEETTGAAFGSGSWEGCAGPEPAGVKMGAIAVAVSMDLRHAAVVAAGLGMDGVTHLRPLQYGPGITWLVSRAKDLRERYGVPVVVDGRGPAAVLIPQLELALGDGLVVASTDDVLNACAAIFTAAQDHIVRHADYPELNDAVSSAIQRPVGKRWAWGRKTATSDVCALEAATLAFWLASSSSPDSVYETRGLVAF